MKMLTQYDAFRDKAAEVMVHGGLGNDGNGIFLIPSNVNATPMRVIASDGGGWHHVSVSLQTRCPILSEMAYIKDLFFREDEYAFQLHVPKSEHVNCHPYCLHLWRSQFLLMPLPPSWMVGPKAESA